MEGVIAALLSAFFFGLSANCSQKGFEGVDLFVGTAITILVSSLLFVLATLLWAPISLWSRLDGGIAVWFAGSGFIHYVLGRTFRNASLISIGASRSGSVAGIAPLFSALLALLVLGEQLTIGLVMGIGFIVGGVYCISTS